MNTLLLGIDIGTSVVKAALFDQHGREVAVAQQRTEVNCPRPGWSETSMEGTWQAATTTIATVLRKARCAGNTVAAVGVSGNMLGVWPIAADGTPLRDAILWNDGRTLPLTAALERADPGLQQRLFRLSGSVMQPGCPAPLIRWLADHEPDVLRQAAALLHAKDWVRFKLTGAVVTDQTDACGFPGDARTQQIDPAVLDWFGIAEHARLLPPVARCEAVVGSVTAAAAAATGLRAGTPVVAGAGDVPAVAIGAGALTPGAACTILGTTCINGLVVPTPTFTPADVGLLFYLPGDRHLRAFANIAGTTNLDWCIDLLFSAERDRLARPALFAMLDATVAAVPVGAHGVIYHPYLNSVGIIAPVVEPAARAQFFGLLPSHTRAELLRAVYEGVALAIRDCYAAADQPLSSVCLTGGGAQSAVWPQLIADCLGVPVTVPPGREFGARGAALLAGVGIGWFTDLAAVATQPDARVFSPDRSLMTSYDTLFATYRAVRAALIGPWQQHQAQSM